MVELVLTRLNDTTTKNKKHYLGRWALNKDEILNSDIIIPYHYDDRGLLERDFNLSIKVYEKLISELTPLLNETHDISFGEREWKIVIGTWLLEFIQVIMDRLLSISLLDKKIEEYSISILDKSSFVTPTTYNDYINNIVADKYNLQLYTEILCYLYPEKEFERLRTKDKETSIHYIKRSKLKRIIQFIINLVIRKPKIHTDIGAFDIKTLLKLLIKSKLKIKPVFSMGDVLIDSKVNIKLRNKLTEKLFGKNDIDTDLYKVLRSLVFIHMPIIYLENFKSIYNDKSLEIFSNSCKKIASDSKIINNDIFKIKTAKQLSFNKSIDIYTVQHGGLYFISKFSTPEYYEIDISDYYITYGSKFYDKCLSISTSKFLHSKELKNSIYKEKVYFISNSFARYYYRNWSNPVPGNSTKEYFRDQKLFFANLQNNILEKIYYRPYITEYGWNELEYLTEENINIEKTGDYSEIISSSELLITDNNHTVMLERLSFNKPIIIYLNPNFWEFHENSLPYINRLKKVNILFDNYKDASDYVNELYEKGKLDIWWNDESTQKVVNDFIVTFAKRNDNLIFDYIKEFQS